MKETKEKLRLIAKRIYADYSFTGGACAYMTDEPQKDSRFLDVDKLVGELEEFINSERADAVKGFFIRLLAEWVRTNGSVNITKLKEEYLKEQNI